MLPTPAPLADAFRPHTPLADALEHPGWQAARDAVLHAVAEGRAAAVLGLPGTGKTLLLRALARALQSAGRPVCLADRGDAVAGPLPGGVLLVDEAERTDAQAWDAVLAHPAPFVLAGLPALAARLDASARAVERVMLDPLSPADVARLIAQRLQAAGHPRATFAPDAVLAVAHHGAGLIRPVLTLAGAAAFNATLDGATSVERRHVLDAAAMHVAPDLAPEPEAAAALVPVAVLRTAPPRAAPQAAVVPAVPRPPEPRAVAAPATPMLADARPPPPVVQRRPSRALAAAVLAGMLGVGALSLAAGRSWDVPAVLALAPEPGPVEPTAVEPAVVEPARHEMAQAAPALAEQGSSALEPLAEPATPPPIPPLLPALPLAEANPANVAPSSVTPSAAPAPVPPAPARAEAQRDAQFRGSFYNETMDQGGLVALDIRRGAGDAVVIRFRASRGLTGTGELRGRLAPDGRLQASGLLMMGRNAFDCDLRGTVQGDVLAGSAQFSRPGSRPAIGRFTLRRA